MEQDNRSIDEIVAALFKNFTYLDAKERVTLYAIMIQIGYHAKVAIAVLDTRGSTLAQVEKESARIDELVINRDAFLAQLYALEKKIPEHIKEDQEYFEAPINHHKQPPLYHMKMSGHRTFHGRRAYKRKRG